MDTLRNTLSLTPGVSVVVPVYNSEQNLCALIERLEPVLVATGRPYEVVLVNDGSRDKSWEIIKKLAGGHGSIRGINFMRNYGQHNALLCGIRSARYDTTITIDDDLQHPPEEIPKLLARLDEGFDVVYGSSPQLQHSSLRNVLSRTTKQMLGWTMGISRAVDINAFRAFRTQIRRGFDDFRSPNPMIDILLSWGTSNFSSVAVQHAPRRAGVSNYTFLKLFNQAMLLITGFTTAPLRLASLVGFCFTLFGMFVFVWVVLRYLLYGSLPGFPFLASIISVFSGAQLFAIGVMGEYVARIFSRTMERPGYVIRDDLARTSSEVEA